MEKTLNSGKDQILQKADFWFFSVVFLGPVSAPLSKLDSAIFVIKVRTIFGADGGCKSLLGQEAPLRAQLMCTVTPLLFLAAQPSSDPCAGVGDTIWLFFSSFSGCKLLTYRAERSPEDGREHKGVGAAQIQPISRTNLSQGLCWLLLHLEGLQKSSCNKDFSPSTGKASTACEINE